jgi:hypothetical protein
LFAIETAIPGGGSGPVCVFVSAANEHRIGPGRLWVRLCRALALDGFRCVRIDVSGLIAGLGDEGASERSVRAIFSLRVTDDILETAKAVSPDDESDVILIGLCSGSYHILEAAVTLRPKGACLVNPATMFQPPEMAMGGEMDARRRFCIPRTALVAAARERRPIEWIGQRFPALTAQLRLRIRKTAWRLRNILEPRRNRPGERIRELADSGTDVLLICGEEEMQPFLETGLTCSGRPQPVQGLQVELIPQLEHSLLPARDREQVAGLILAHVRSRFLPLTKA